jgi:hypothetical protein
MSSPTPVPRPFRLSGRTRKGFLVVHIVAAAMWFGIDLALGILAVTALLTDSPQTAGIALRSIELFAVWPMFGASLVCLGSGVVLGLGTRYGLLRYWWVAVKLAINVLMATLILFALRPDIGEAAQTGRRLMAGDPAATVPTGLLAPVLVAPTLLLLAYVLATFKPGGPTRPRASARNGRTSRRPVAAAPAPTAVSSSAHRQEP